MHTTPATTDEPHAEVVEVWPRDGVIRLVGHVAGLADAPDDGWTLESRARERRRAPSLAGRVRSRLRNRLRAAPRVLAHPAHLEDGRFTAEIPVGALVPPRRGAVEHWDLSFVHADGRRLRAGRWLDDMPGKKRIVAFPTQQAGRGTKVRPYFTDGDALAVRVTRTGR
ncbi:hypothetical protein BTM25_39560 [Actinomadura rubteroloni]|uniref:Uncharacterized protein n=1 Tax=Actinomadura rubteroloni TaxID=1926885 RepID=A0A2P4UJU1_9ACTN|nr:hypothetical protein [Actinomadura rubteroloni]POM25312.1 hypothetical protein BTM25_39560 [Actinomadura rubteroloni]